MKILGIELGTWSIKAVDILDLHEIMLPVEFDDPVATYKNGVSQLMARLPSHPERIVTSLPVAQTALRFLRVPIKQRKKVEKMYRYELEDTTPFSLEDCIVEHHVERAKDGSIVFAAMAPKKHIKAHTEWLIALGIDPDWLTFDGMGLINLYMGRPQTKEEKKAGSEETTVLIDIGHSKTTLAFIENDRLSFFRSISWGGSALNQVIASALTINLEEAEKKKMRELTFEKTDEDSQPEQPLQSAATEAFSSLFVDILHSFSAFRSIHKKEVSRILLTGGTANIPGITNLFSRHTGILAHQLNPLSLVDYTKPTDASQANRFAEALGRAPVFGRKSHLLFNFRRKDVGKSTGFTEASLFLKNPLVIRAGILSLILVAILFAHVTISTIFAKQDASKARNELTKIFTSTFRSVPKKMRINLMKNPEQLAKFLDNKEKELNQRIRMATKETKPILGVIQSISASFPKEVRVDVNTIELDTKNVKIEGVLYSGDIKKVTDNLNNNPNFENFKLTQKDKRFTYQGQVKGR